MFIPVPPAPGKKQSRIYPLIFILLALIAIVFLIVKSVNMTSGPLAASCTLGIVGWPTNITLSGNSASQDCDMFVQQYPQQYYHMSDTPTGDTMCEGDLSHGHTYYQYSPSSYYKYYIPAGLNDIHYIVRSAPEYNPIGNSICSALIGPQSQ